MQFIDKNGYRFYTHCRFCSSPLFDSVINLNSMPPAGGFLKSSKDFSQEKLYPLTLAFCEHCYLLQTREIIPADTLFKNYFYFSSAIKTLVTHFKTIAQEFSSQVSNPQEKLVLEIGCNDGSFLKACLNEGFNAVGVDPAINVVTPLIKKGMPIINDYFTENVAEQINKQYGKADIIFSSNTLAHIENMHDVFAGITTILKDDGMLVFENHYLGNLIKDMQYDMIYHEHQYYYSVSTMVNFLAQHNLELFDLRFIKIHAGSIRFYVQRKNGGRKVNKIVTDTLKQEHYDKLTDKKTFISYNNKIKKTKANLISLLNKLKEDKKTIAGYGASGRGTIVMNYCGLTDKYIDYVIDDAPAKQGTYTPGTHSEIVSSAILQTKKKPDYVVLFAWSFIDEIKKRNKSYLDSGGKFIVPLPKVQIIS